MNVILLHSTHRHVSATPVSIYMMVRTRIQLLLYYCIHHLEDGHMSGRKVSVCTNVIKLHSYTRVHLLVFKKNIIPLINARNV
jgi:hypothetical protein